MPSLYDTYMGGTQRWVESLDRLRRNQYEKEFSQFGGSPEEFAVTKGVSLDDPAMAGIVAQEGIKSNLETQAISNKYKNAMIENWANLESQRQYERGRQLGKEDRATTPYEQILSEKGIELPPELEILYSMNPRLLEELGPYLKQYLKPEEKEEDQDSVDLLRQQIASGKVKENDLTYLQKRLLKVQQPPSATPSFSDIRITAENVLDAENEILQNLSGTGAEQQQGNVRYFNKNSDADYKYKYIEEKGILGQKKRIIRTVTVDGKDVEVIAINPDGSYQVIDPETGRTGTYVK